MCPTPATSVRRSSPRPGWSPECTTTCTSGSCWALAVFSQSKNGITINQNIICLPHRCFLSYKSPYFAIFQMLGAGVYQNKVKRGGKKRGVFFPSFLFPQLFFLTSFSKVTASIQVLADSDNPQIPIILSNFSNIVSHKSLGVRFITKGCTTTFINHIQTKIFTARDGH